MPLSLPIIGEIADAAKAFRYRASIVEYETRFRNFGAIYGGKVAWSRRCGLRRCAYPPDHCRMGAHSRHCIPPCTTTVVSKIVEITSPTARGGLKYKRTAIRPGEPRSQCRAHNPTGL